MAAQHDAPMTEVEVEGQFAGVDAVLQVEDTRVFADGEELGTGLLSVEESNLRWASSDGSAGLELEYPSIALHAVSRDTTSFPHHCVYLQCVRPAFEGEGGEGEGEGEEEEEVVEYRLVPPSPEHLSQVYEAISHCQTLYPDPQQSDSEAGEEGEEGEREEGEEGVDLEGGDFFTTTEGLDHLSPQGLATLSHLESLLQHSTPSTDVETTVSNGGGVHDPLDQFEDAD